MPPAPAYQFNLEQVLHNVRSDQQPIRAFAMQALLRQCEKDPGLHAIALPIFQEHLPTAPDFLTASCAARGIALIAGQDPGRWAWLSLLYRPQADLVGDVASVLNDDYFLPTLLELLLRRPEFTLQFKIIRALGRMKNPAAFGPIAARLSDPKLRPHAIESLGDLGDPRAIPYLEPLLKDNTQAWEEDNHGPLLYVRDLANRAIARLRSHHP